MNIASNSAGVIKLLMDSLCHGRCDEACDELGSPKSC